ncbi:MAG: alpha-L-fucosidase, partial [Bryobacterales bacterium]|nr:alpha-L-fucosidase [Bryobacterales bacterium]
MKWTTLLMLAPMMLGADDAVARERLRRFHDAKFGMFIHWGPYSLASVEASWPIMRPGNWKISEAEYRALPERFNPVQFDARAWVRLAKAAGQRYIVFTTKHHDGFCMFDSQFTDYKITRSPYGKDIVAQLAEAAKAEGMPLGFYYSPPDLNHPGFRDTSKLSATNWNGEPARPEWPLYLDYMELQLRELLTRYGDVFVIWFDGLSNHAKYTGERFHELIHKLQPTALINNRIGPTGDFVTPEQRLPNGIPRKGAKVGNVDPNDKGLATSAPPPDEFQPWETCMTINRTWGYNKR